MGDGAFEPFSKSSGGLSYILLITLHSITFISIDDRIFLYACDRRQISVQCEMLGCPNGQ